MDFAHLEKCQCEKESKAFWLWPLSLFHNYGIVLLDYACFFPSWRLVFLQDHYGDHYLKCLLCSFWYKQLVLDCLSFICQISVWCTSTVRRLWKYTLKKPHYFTAKFQWKILCFFFPYSELKDCMWWAWSLGEENTVSMQGTSALSLCRA